MAGIICRNIANFDEEAWNAKAPETAYVCCSEKFRKYPRAAKELIRSYPCTLAEASSELPWGCGMSLKNPKVTDKKLWKGQGIMGRVLETIREELMAEQPELVEEQNTRLKEVRSPAPWDVSLPTDTSEDPTEWS